jgi:hypothetical protein
MFVWTIPDGLCTFVNRQFLRFQAPFPSERALNEIGELTIDYVARNNYFPGNVEEALWRFNNPHIGLTESERYKIAAPIEYKIKVKMLEKISFEQLHLAVWSALMWCWTEEGFTHVSYIIERNKKDLAISADCPF